MADLELSSSGAPALPDGEALERLGRAEVVPVGVLTQASNLTLLAELHEGGEPTGHRAVYKPVSGEQPLRDFPPGTLAGREAAAYLVSSAAGLDVVPPTVLRDGPLGPGSVQWWVEQDAARLADPAGGLVEVLAPHELTESWLPVVSGETEEGAPVVVAHADDPALRMMAVLDVVLNNADRKAAHLTRGLDGRLRGFDHGLCLHTDDKLRTVLWGWAGQSLTGPEEEALALLDVALAPGGALAAPLADLLAEAEVDALRARVGALLAAGELPAPPDDRYPLPWPLW